MKILLVDDHEALCVALASYIQSHASDFGQESDGVEKLTVIPLFNLLDAAAQLRIDPPPRLVLLDLGMEGESQGATTLETLQNANNAKVPIAVFTGLTPHSPGATQIFRKCLLEHGARGIIMKTGKMDKMLVGLGRLLNGDPWIPEEVLMAMLADPDPTDLGHSPVGPRFGLTNREWDIALLLTKGLQTKIIASRLGLTPGHVSQVITVILGKLDVGNRTQAAIKLKDSLDDANSVQ